MKIDEIFLLWDKDSKIDRSDLAVESLSIPIIHNKYYKILVPEKLKLRKMQADYTQLVKIYQEYFLGQLSEEELKQYGLTPYPLRLLKADIPTYMNSEQKIIDAQLRIAQQEEKVELLNAIIKILIARTFHIKNAIDFLKFQNGT